MTGKLGQPTKMTRRRLERLQEALEKGLPRWAACAYAKISRQCFNEWLQGTQDPPDQPGKFRQMVAEWEAVALNGWVDAISKQPDGARFLITKRFREDYGDALRVDTVGSLVIKVIEDDGRRDLDPPPSPPSSAA